MDFSADDSRYIRSRTCWYAFCYIFLLSTSARMPLPAAFLGVPRYRGT